MCAWSCGRVQATHLLGRCSHDAVRKGKPDVLVLMIIVRMMMMVRMMMDTIIMMTEMRIILMMRIY